MIVSYIGKAMRFKCLSCYSDCVFPIINLNYSYLQEDIHVCKVEVITEQVRKSTTNVPFPVDEVTESIALMMNKTDESDKPMQEAGIPLDKIHGQCAMANRSSCGP